MRTPDYSTWLTKQQAADAIGISTKTVEQLAQKKQIQQAYWKRPETGAKVSVYHPLDVERIRRERNPDAEPFVLPGRTTSEKSESTAVATRQPAPEQFLQALVLASSQNSQRVRTAEKLYLTVSEAAELSGLPRTYVRQQMKDGKLPALKTGAGWRVKRSDLERL